MHTIIIIVILVRGYGGAQNIILHVQKVKHTGIGTEGTIYYYDLHIVDFNNYTYIHAEPFPSPNGMFLSDIGPTHMTFKWSPLLLNCPSLKYIITSERSNCGICPNTTTNTTATCTDMTIDHGTDMY